MTRGRVSPVTVAVTYVAFALGWAFFWPSRLPHRRCRPPRRRGLFRRGGGRGPAPPQPGKVSRGFGGSGSPNGFLLLLVLLLCGWPRVSAARTLCRGAASHRALLRASGEGPNRVSGGWLVFSSRAGYRAGKGHAAGRGWRTGNVCLSVRVPAQFYRAGFRADSQTDRLRFLFREAARAESRMFSLRRARAGFFRA